MAYDADEAVDLLDHLLSKQRRHGERRSSAQEVLPAIKMVISDWYTDELGVLTREIRAQFQEHHAQGLDRGAPPPYRTRRTG